ncbi:Abi family protein [bacterium]|nr:Abi family protein [bacterium]HNO92309.1 Abi family protein [bacterium]
MKFQDFERIMTTARLSRYQAACGGNSKRAMTLYRKNLQLSQELFTVISCFEIALRNAIDKQLLQTRGNDWLRNGATAGGIFDNPNCRLTKENIDDAMHKLNHFYTHNKLVAELGFGFWRYMFAPNQFAATGKTLLQIFPAKPTSTAAIQYNHTFVFNQLAQINNMRNRIAHHEPICFVPGQSVKGTTYARQHYGLILQLFQWMSIDEGKLLYGIDHINTVCNQIDAL